MKNGPDDKSRVEVAEWKARKPNVTRGSVISRAQSSPFQFNFSPLRNKLIKVPHLHYLRIKRVYTCSRYKGVFQPRIPGQTHQSQFCVRQLNGQT